MPGQLLLFLKCLMALTLIALGERLLFFAYNTSLMGKLSLPELIHTALWGLRFDFAVAAILSLLAYLSSYIALRLLSASFLKVFRLLTYAAAFTLIVLQGADIMYFAEAGRHLGYEIFDFVTDAVALLATALTDHPLTFLLHMALAAAVVWLLSQLFREKEKYIFTAERKSRWFHLPELQLFPVLLITVILVRGGFQSVPQSPLSAQAIGDTHKATLALNGAYNALYFAFSEEHVQPVKLVMADELQQQALIRNLYPADTSVSMVSTSTSMQANSLEHKQYNVVMILLESWSAAYMKSYGFNRDVTPYFGALRTRSLTTYNMLAGGHRTTEGMFAVFCSAQNPLGQTIAQSQLQDFNYHCLPQLLREQGYYTAFFQGTNKNTSGTGVFAQMLGFTDSYGRKDVTHRQYEENSWGVHDPDLYRLVTEKMRAAKQPFFMGINTATTHDITLPSGVKPAFDPGTAEDPMLNTMHFADASLQNFIESVQQDNAIGPTVFVLVADHTSYLSSSNYRMYSVPFAINAPGIVAPRFVDRVASQRDIAPTLLQVLGVDAPAHFTGKSLLRDDQAPYFADYYHNGALGWVEGEQLLEFPVVDPGNYKCYDYRRDPVQSRSVPCKGDAEITLQHALAFTATSQNLLFSGHLRDFSALKPNGFIRTGLTAAKQK